MKVSCVLCGTKCVGCAGRCRCGLRDQEVQKLNAILAEKPERLKDKDKLELIKSYAKKRTTVEAIISSIENKVEVEEISPTISIYCEYPIGSGGLGAYVKCAKCGVERYLGRGKLCKGSTEEEKEKKGE